jgi:acyl dehydratase
MRFAELTSGRSIECGSATLTDEEIIAFGRDYDPQWFHTDPARAAAGPWKGLIASGWQTCGLAMRLIGHAILDGSESFGSPGLAYLKWENPVRAGDVLKLTVDVLDQRTARSNPALGIVRWRWRLTNQDDATVLDLEATSLFDLNVAP